MTVKSDPAVYVRLPQPGQLLRQEQAAASLFMGAIPDVCC